MAQFDVNTSFDFHASLDWTGGTAVITDQKVTLAKGSDVLILGGRFYISGSSLAGTASSVDFKSGGVVQWSEDGTSYWAGNLQRYALAPGGTQDFYGYLFGGDDRVESRGVGSILDGYAGTNTISYRSAGGGVTVNLASGTANSAAGTDKLFHFANATGSAFADVLIGNSTANVLDGLAGADTMTGGQGDDTYVIDNTGDTIVESRNGGIDTVLTPFATTLAATLENLTLTGKAAVDGMGNALDNTIIGNAGDNVLDGGAGADFMQGGAGDDTYVVDNVGDRVDDGGDVVNVDGTGFDTILSSVDVVGPRGIEAIVLTGTGDISAKVSNDRPENAVGVKITGNVGDNVLDGRGGGIETLAGGKGDDTYWVGRVNQIGGDYLPDRVVEAAASGYDTVYAATKYTLGANVEALVLLEFNDSYYNDGYGNSLGNALTGNRWNNTLDGRGGKDTMAGLRGDDTYVVDNAGDRVIEEARGGKDLVQSSVSFRLGDFVEDLTLTGRAAIDGAGNALANTLIGNKAANVLDGGAGADEFDGGQGNDLYIIDNVRDRITGDAGGQDSVQSSVSFDLAYGIEKLKLTGTANSRGTGNSSDNVIEGNAGNNLIDGGDGKDLLIGGEGNDIYVVTFGDTVVEHRGGGIDEVRSSVYIYTLGANIEKLTLLDNAKYGTGNSLDNTLIGGNYDDVLDGAAGADTMIGRGGENTYVVDNIGDRIVDDGAASVRASIDYTLHRGWANLTLIGDADLSATGNSDINVLIGNDGDNVLNGGGGGDWLRGGLGDDTYMVVDPIDQVYEALATGGVDTVISNFSHSLVYDGFVENLTLSGRGAIDATGNGFDNVLIGNDAANKLSGGKGADRMVGGAGDDSYSVDAAGDAVVELAGQGIDTVSASTKTYRLGDNVENLELDDAEGSKASNGYGNELDNLIRGNQYHNLLDGGTGSDTLSYERLGRADVDLARGTARKLDFGTTDVLRNFENLIGWVGDDKLAGNDASNRITGGEGADDFVFNSLLSTDTITDFLSKTDQVWINQDDIRVGNGDTTVDGAARVAGPGGFGTEAELVIVTDNIDGVLSRAAAAAAIGSANGTYDEGDTVLFAVDNGHDSALFLFTAADADAAVSAAELTRIGILSGAASTVAADYAWVV